MDAISVRQPHRVIIKNMRSCTKLFITVVSELSPSVDATFLSGTRFWEKRPSYIPSGEPRNEMREIAKNLLFRFASSICEKRIVLNINQASGKREFIFVAVFIIMSSPFSQSGE